MLTFWWSPDVDFVVLNPDPRPQTPDTTLQITGTKKAEMNCYYHTTRHSSQEFSTVALVYKNSSYQLAFQVHCNMARILNGNAIYPRSIRSWYDTRNWHPSYTRAGAYSMDALFQPFYCLRKAILNILPNGHFLLFFTLIYGCVYTIMTR